MGHKPEKPWRHLAGLKYVIVLDDGWVQVPPTSGKVWERTDALQLATRFPTRAEALQFASACVPMTQLRRIDAV